MANIMVVDDVPAVREYLRIVLASVGHEVVQASDGAEALTAMQQSKPDLVISDGLMPVMDGFRLCLAIRQDPGLADVGFILYTASFATAEDNSLALDLGADAYVLKPAEPAELLTVVGNVLGQDPADRGPFDRPLDALLTRYGERIEGKLDSKIAELSETQSTLDSLHAILDHLPILVATVDENGTPEYLNRAMRRFAGVDDVAEWDYDQLGDDFERIRIRGAFNEAAESGKPLEFSLRLKRADGESRRVKMSVLPTRDAEKTHLILAGLDVTEAEEHDELLLFLAEHDMLTGLPNRRSLDARFETLLPGFKEGKSAALLFIDLDRFKTVNDEYGHDVGDLVLANFASILKSETPSDGLAVRLCGDEFVMLLADADTARAQAVAEQVRKRLASATLVPDVPQHKVTASIGIHVMPEPTDEGAALLAADTALIEAKSRGRDRTSVSKAAETELPLAELAVDGRRIDLIFIPVYSLETGALTRCAVRASILVDERRFADDEITFGALRRGVAREFTRAVARQAVDAMRSADMKYSLRLSLADILDPGTFDDIARLTEEVGVSPTRLRFAIPIRHLLGGTLPPTLLHAAKHSPIGLTLDCAQASAGEVLAVAAPPFDTIKLLPGTLSAISTEAASREVIDKLKEHGMDVLVTGLDSADAVREARAAGATLGEGGALAFPDADPMRIVQRIDMP